jgi:ABC-type lipoprotein export system ATPase subunit
MPTASPLSIGSIWRRWDPHIHTPGTLLSDQFGDDWEAYLTQLESSEPKIEALGITDYFSLDTYKQVLAHKKSGRLKDVGLIFPNIEMRLNVDTDKKKAINVHYLFSPDDANHIEEIERALYQFTFDFNSTTYHCSRSDLIRLGRARLGVSTDEHVALKDGANQFKVTFDQIKAVYQGSPWMKSNCIIAVSGSSNDGPPGLQGDSSFDALREEIDRTSHVVFSATDSTRQYWLGRRTGFDRDHIEKKYGCLKGCIHGSDAHRVEKVGAPDLKRYCWIKGDTTFEALRQIILEPEDRVHIGDAPPYRIDTGDHVTRVCTENTPWLANNDVPLNQGLVAIIGGRGSGKTALADIIARAAGADQASANNKSFLYRASEHLAGASVTMYWANEDPSTATLVTDTYSSDLDLDDGSSPKIRYLSQQFVERLCTSTGLHAELVDEIERVIFNETASTDRLDCDSFEQLATLYLDPIKQTREGLQDAISEISTQIVTEDGLVDSLPKLRQAVVGWEAKNKSTEAQMKKLLPTGDTVRATRLSELETAFTAVSTSIDKEKRRIQRLQDLRTDIANVRKTHAPAALEKLKGRFPDLGLASTEWENFLLDYVGDIETVIQNHEVSTNAQIAKLSTSAAVASVPASLTPSQWPLDRLAKEKKLLEDQVGIDVKNKTKYTGLQSQLDQDHRSLERAKEDLQHANGASQRREQLRQKRRDLYRECIQSFVDETNRLEQLYAPLHDTFAKGSGTITRLRFAVTRQVDLDTWINSGKENFDLRLESNLRGHDRLREIVRQSLLPAWQTGDADSVSAAMTAFIQANYSEMNRLKPREYKTKAEIDAWNQSVAAWLFGTKHISLSYSMTYDNVPVERLSPGTRGIVLLLLYLVIDKKDKRPLLIDQPEENLDPRSVYQELVGHFRDARKRRQVIIVTHNANLVVNADADQVIVATPIPNMSGGLPTIQYESGSLEDPRIRTSVCQILEGGERAFLDRERRYRLQRSSGNLIS